MKKQTSATIETFIKGRTVTDFSGKIIYVGIDLHQKDYQVAKILDGICSGNHRMCADNDQLIETSERVQWSVSPPTTVHTR